MERAKTGGWGLVVLDVVVDSTTPGGELMANVVAVFAQYGRQLAHEVGRRRLEDQVPVDLCAGTDWFQWLK